MEIIAWLILRIVYAWMFLYPLTVLIPNWESTVDLVKLIVPFAEKQAAVLMIAVMIIGALSILLGLYAQAGGFLLMVYSLVGFVVHTKLAAQVNAFTLSEQASATDKTILKNATDLGFVGHTTSAQKNIVLAALGCFFMLIGSGPLSITGNLF